MKTAHIGYSNIYEVIFAYIYTWTIIFVQAKYLYDASLGMREKLWSYSQSQAFLPKRWFGMNIDLSDWQWITFDYHFPKQLIFALVYIITMQTFKYLIKRVFKRKLLNENKYQNLTKAVKNITDLYAIINFAFCVYMHGTSTLFMLLIMSITYFLSITTYKYRCSNLVAWAWNLCVGVIVSKYDHSYFAFGVLVHPSWSWMDSWINVNMRWNQVYRLTMLRCISFHMDLRSKYLGQKLYKCPFDGQEYRDYVELEDFSMINFFAYTLYTPLMISGPIISFYDWMNQLKCNLSYDGRSPYRDQELSYKYLMV